MLCFITCVMLCYITGVMLCHITYVTLYNMCHVYNICSEQNRTRYITCHFTLYNICHVMFYDIHMFKTEQNML